MRGVDVKTHREGVKLESEALQVSGTDGSGGHSRGHDVPHSRPMDKRKDKEKKAVMSVR